MKKILPFLALPLLLSLSYGVHLMVYSGEQRAQQKSLQRADLLMAAEDYSGAVQQLATAAKGDSANATLAQQRIIKLGSDASIGDLDIIPFQQLSQTLLRQDGQLRLTIHQQLWAQSSNDALSLQQRFIIVKNIAKQPDSLTLLALDAADIDRRLIDLYQQWLLLHASDHSAAQDLAMLYFKQRRINDMVALLQQHQQHLGSSEAASVLGQLYLSANNYWSAEKYLIDYSEPRLRAIVKLKQQLISDAEAVSATRFNNSDHREQQRQQLIDELERQLTAIRPVAEQLASLLVSLANSGQQPKHRQQRLDKADWILSTLQPAALTTTAGY